MNFKIGRLFYGLMCTIGLSTIAHAGDAPRPARSESTTVAESAGTHVTSIDITAFVSALPVDKARSVREPDGAASIARDLVVRRQLAERARTEGFDRDAIVAARLKLAMEKLLSDLYLERAETRAVNDELAEKLARSDYGAFPEKYRGDSVHVRHLLIGPHRSCDRDGRSMAEGLLARLRSGEAFDALATQYSDDPGSASKGGDLGWIERGKTVLPFEAAAFALRQAGELSDVVETQFGYHLIQLIERKTGKRPYDEVKEPLIEANRVAQKTQARRAILDPLLDPKTIQIDLPNLDAAVKAAKLQ